MMQVTLSPRTAVATLRLSASVSGPRKARPVRSATYSISVPLPLACAAAARPRLSAAGRVGEGGAWWVKVVGGRLARALTKAPAARSMMRRRPAAEAEKVWRAPSQTS